ncbi:hypothetical protein ACFLY6_02315 [Candidatus Dependentiae bacterium]
MKTARIRTLTAIFVIVFGSWIIGRTAAKKHMAICWQTGKAT